jgi:hypothetical protein
VNFRAAEGLFASPNPRAVVLAGSFAFRAGPDGLAVARFAWANPDTGEAANARTAPNQLLGFVLPVLNGITAVRVARGVRYARPGVGVTMMAGGDYWAKFDNGAVAGDRVYASLVDGSAISGEAGAAEATPWYVVTNVGPGGLAIISTTSKVTL